MGELWLTPIFPSIFHEFPWFSPGFHGFCLIGNSMEFMGCSWDIYGILPTTSGNVEFNHHLMDI
jgi:hypothetical protein